MKFISDEGYKLLFFNHPVPILILDADSYDILEVNKAAEKKYGFSHKEFLQHHLSALFSSGDYTKFLAVQEKQNGKSKVNKSTFLNLKKNSQQFFAEINISELDADGKTLKMAAIMDVTEHTIAQQNFEKSTGRYHFLTEETFDAIWDWDLVTGKLNWNDNAKKMFELKTANQLEKNGWWSENIHPEDKERVEKKLNIHLQQGITQWHDEYRFLSGSGNYKYISDRGYLVYDENKKPVKMIGAMQDLTHHRQHEIELQNLNNSLKKRAKELAESNEELERFAYVASHDLQEPLRMVTSFLQLLEKRYKDKLDTKGHEYIAYAVDGAERMKKLILDLLEYSRVNTSVVVKETVSMNELLHDIQFTYTNILKDTNGTITSTELPVLMGNRTQLMQLLQNIIGNAFKYRSDRAPLINISYEKENTFHKFAISDNGIGIDPRFYKKIFIIFQRLHTRQQYSGTGIGLAICKKIIDKHGGKIWVSSEPGVGSTFYFTLPKS